jgi:alanyl-tRNA synthetase
VRPITTTLDEARALGAMALFGEKYGDVVRMVQIGDGDYSRELCGGTHVRSTAEIGVFKLASESSSAANVRRIEAITGPVAVAELRAADAKANETAKLLKTGVAQLPAAVAALRKQVKDAAKAATSSNGAGTIDADSLAAAATQIDGADVVAQVVTGVANAKELPDIADRVKGKLGEQSATVLGTVVDGRVHLVAAVTPALVARGVRAGAIVKAAAQVAGGGGGGRDTMAQAGGKDPAALPDAIAAARAAIAAALAE